MAKKTFLIQLRVLGLVVALLVSSTSFGLSNANLAVILLSNSVSILGGLGLLTSASVDIAQEKTNSTVLGVAHEHVSAVSHLLLGLGQALEIVGSEMAGKSKLVNRIDEAATLMTSIGFVLLAAGIWSSTTNTILVGSVLVGSFFITRGFLLPLVIKAHRNSFQTSDMALLGALTFFGNIAGFLLTWGTFETESYSRRLLQVGDFLLGILNPVVFTGLTINVLMNMEEELAPWA